MNVFAKQILRGFLLQMINLFDNTIFNLSAPVYELLWLILMTRAI